MAVASAGVVGFDGGELTSERRSSVTGKNRGVARKRANEAAREVLRDAPKPVGART